MKPRCSGFYIVPAIGWIIAGGLGLFTGQFNDGLFWIGVGAVYILVWYVAGFFR